MKISICIPTYNRAAHLANCLQSIASLESRSAIDFQVCVSDNCSTDETEDVVRAAQQAMPIVYQKNSRNIGMSRNFLRVVDMADADFVWLVGDDDLLMPHALKALVELIENHPSVDFFYVNAFHLKTEYVFSFPQPFDIRQLPTDMVPFSSWAADGELPFTDLINPKISFDFLGGIFLSVFRRQLWVQHVDALSAEAIADPRVFSHFDNTFPHLKIFSRAFTDSRAYFNSNSLIVCLTGAREWAPMYPLVHSVRLVEALKEYRKNGLSRLSYWRCRNYALNNFLPDLVSMAVHRKRSGYSYIKPLDLILENCLYPNFYLSLVNFFIRKGKLLFSQTRQRARGSKDQEAMPANLPSV